MALKRNRHEQEQGEVERASWVMRGLLGVFFVVALIGLYKVLPLNSNPLIDRGMRKVFNEAQAMEADGMYRSAAQNYTEVIQAHSAKKKLRSEAAERLGEIYAMQLQDPAAAMTALEQAWFWAPEGERRDALRKRIEFIGGDDSRAVNTITENVPPTAPDENAATAKDPAVVSIGDGDVSVEQILFAWQQINGLTPPEVADFEAFVQRYLDMVLLAAEAERMGLDDIRKVRYDLELKRVLALSNALTEQMITELPDPGDAELEAFRERLRAATGRAGQLAVSHIVVNTTGSLQAVQTALDGGEIFAAVAQQHSLDRQALPEGCRLGRVDLGAQGIERVGAYPGLVPFLAQLDDGATTGPIRLNRGWHWFRMDGHISPPPDPPLSGVREQVLQQYQEVELARRRQALLKRLRDERPIVVHSQDTDGASSETLESER